MGGSTSKPAAPASHRITPSEQGALDIKRHRDRMCKAEARMAFEAAALQARAVTAYAAGDRPGATTFVKLRKLKLFRRDALVANVQRCEEMLATLESMADAAAVALVMEAGTAALRALQADMPLARAEAIAEGLEDAMEAAAEVDAVLRRELGVGGGEDLAADLDRLMAELDGAAPVPAERRVAGLDASALPTIPSGPVGAAARPKREARVAVAQ
jgi:hypothetical protein